MIAFYKPNPKVKGHGCSFQYTDEGDFYFNFIKQTGWNDSTKRGEFNRAKDGSNTMSGKLMDHEVGSIINCIESNREFSAFHKSTNQSLSIKFAPYVNKEKVQVGFSFAVNQTTSSGEKRNFLMGLTFGEAVTIREFFKTCLNIDHQNKIEKYNSYKPKANKQPEAVTDTDEEELEF